MVSIIPGIDTAAPERTDRSRGEVLPPNCFPVASSVLLRFASTSEINPSGRLLCRITWRHASVEMVNPGGTGTPIRVISARLAPFPPSRLFCSRVPSAPPPPKKYTHRCDDIYALLA